jgi:hypothetical protein
MNRTSTKGIEMKNEYKILLQNLNGRDHLGDLGTGIRIILERMLKT